jgi:hypothetical protein
MKDKLSGNQMNLLTLHLKYQGQVRTHTKGKVKLSLHRNRQAIRAPEG